MGGWVECQAWADPGARTPIGASRFCFVVVGNRVYIHWSVNVNWECFSAQYLEHFNKCQQHLNLYVFNNLKGYLLNCLSLPKLCFSQSLSLYSLSTTNTNKTLPSKLESELSVCSLRLTKLEEIWWKNVLRPRPPKETFSIYKLSVVCINLMDVNYDSFMCLINMSYGGLIIN
jgi:hypothetical protein